MVRPDYGPVSQAREVAMKCGLCGKIAFGPRDQMEAAMDEHRRVACTGGSAEATRKYELWYPR